MDSPNSNIGDNTGASSFNNNNDTIDNTNKNMSFDQLTPREAAKRMKEVIYPDFDAIDMGEGWKFDRPIKPRRKRTFRDELQMTTVGQHFIHFIFNMPRTCRTFNILSIITFS